MLIFFQVFFAPHGAEALLDPPSNNMTLPVFGSVTDGLPAAFGDFNSDELTDMFVLRDDRHTLQILLGADTEPLLRPAPDGALKCTYEKSISSVVPGDFDGNITSSVYVSLVQRSL